MTGLNDESLRRHLQRQALPLQPTGTVGEFVAGVRYRAWAAAVGSAPDDRRACTA